MISVVSRRALARAALSISTAVLILAATRAPAAAQDPAQAPPPPPPTDIVHRGELFGDWGGAREKLGQKQSKIDVSYTQFFDWVPVGDDNRGFDYGGKFDVKAEANLSKYRWDGFSMGGHFEVRYGDVPLLAGGTLIPTSTALLFPESAGTHAAVTSLYGTQVFENKFVLQFGRFNFLLEKEIEKYAIDDPVAAR